MSALKMGTKRAGKDRHEKKLKGADSEMIMSSSFGIKVRHNSLL
jgi:hypothetical protein